MSEVQTFKAEPMEFKTEGPRPGSTGGKPVDLTAGATEESGLQKLDKRVPKDVTDTHLDELSSGNTEAAFQKLERGSGGGSAFFRPDVAQDSRKYHRAKHFNAKRANGLVSTKNGLFAPTLQGAEETHTRTPMLVRRRGSEGYALPIDGLRLDSEAMKLPVTRLELPK